MLLAAGTGVSAACWSGNEKVANEFEYGGPPKRLELKVDDSRITESSGVAPSRRNSNLVYTHNDSGDSARFFSLNLADGTVQEFTVANAEAIDWEDMASTQLDGEAYLYFGDIGDNKEKRSSIRIYRVPEPTGPGRSVRADLDIELTYPDGPHNAESLLVDAKTGDIQIVTKTSKGPSGIYWVARPNRSGKFALTKLGEIDLPVFGPAKLLTSGSISADNRYLVLRTYLAGYEFDYASHERDWFKQKPREVEFPPAVQGEAITYSTDVKSLITTSEGRPCPLAVFPSGH